jgi:hypothetical protein
VSASLTQCILLHPPRWPPQHRRGDHRGHAAPGAHTRWRTRAAPSPRNPTRTSRVSAWRRAGGGGGGDRGGGRLWRALMRTGARAAATGYRWWGHRCNVRRAAPRRAGPRAHASRHAWGTGPCGRAGGGDRGRGRALPDGGADWSGRRGGPCSGQPGVRTRRHPAGEAAAPTSTGPVTRVWRSRSHQEVGVGGCVGGWVGRVCARVGGEGHGVVDVCACNAAVTRALRGAADRMRQTREGEQGGGGGCSAWRAHRCTGVAALRDCWCPCAPPPRDSVCAATVAAATAVAEGRGGWLYSSVADTQQPRWRRGSVCAWDA